MRARIATSMANRSRTDLQGEHQMISVGNLIVAGGAIVFFGLKVLMSI